MTVPNPTRYRGYRISAAARLLSDGSARYVGEVFITPHDPPEIADFEASINVAVEWIFDTRQAAIRHVLREAHAFLDRLNAT